MFFLLSTATWAAEDEVLASGELLWTVHDERNGELPDRRLGGSLKVYGRAAHLLRFGAAAHRGVQPHATRLDGLLGIELPTGDWGTFTVALQLGVLVPDGSCGSGCERWQDYRDRPPVGFGRVVLSGQAHPTPNTDIVATWALPPWPRPVDFRPTLGTIPLGYLLPYGLLRSSLFVSQRAVRVGATWTTVLIDLRAPLELLYYQTGSFRALTTAFGPRIGGGIAIEPGLPVATAFEVMGGTSIGGPYVAVGFRLGPYRDHLVW